MQEQTLSFGEKMTFSLRSLFEQYGYARFKMSKFEEYDLYARNKDFLISDSVITFTDTNGRLMALKPDVTLSIVKNSKDVPGTVQKLYYNENVYRVAKGGHSFQEILQVGLECLGDIDEYCICEVLTLAAKSLRSISENCVLDISHLGFLSEVMDSMGIPAGSKSSVLNCIGEKNRHELATLCQELGVAEKNTQQLMELATMRGTPDKILPRLKEQYPQVASIGQLDEICTALADCDVAMCIDFSVVDDIHYYNGIIFKGFVEGIADSVLSGGQYDRLMQKLKRRSGAIGFAVYMDQLERLEKKQNPFDVDVVLLYDKQMPVSVIRQQAAALTEQGKTVMVQPGVPENIKYKQLIKLQGSEVEILENNA